MKGELPSADEIEVAEILFELPEVILTRELCSRVAFVWGSRKRRSVLTKAEASVPAPPLGVKAEAPSPTTPLSFPPSESDSKRKAHHRRDKKKRRDLIKSIGEVTQRNLSMKREIQKVSSYYDKLKAYNLQLKAKKEELIKARMYTELGQNRSLGQQNDNNQELHHQPLIQDPTVQVPSSKCNESPRGIPDLNISLEEPVAVDAPPLDLTTINRNLSRALIASQARRRRVEINRIKNFHSANKQRYLFG